MNHAMIQKWQAEKAITVKQGCEIFAISRAGYYSGQRVNDDCHSFDQRLQSDFLAAPL